MTERDYGNETPLRNAEQMAGVLHLFSIFENSLP